MSAPDLAIARTPQAQLMQMGMGFTVSFLLRTAAQLCLADHMAAGVEDVEQLAGRTGTNPSALYRLLRALGAIGICNEGEGHRFSLTELAEPLRSNVPGSVRASILSCTGDLFVIPWHSLLYSVQSGKPSFDKEFGVPFSDHIRSEPEEAAWFSELLVGINISEAPAVAAAYDFSRYAQVVDVGGGTGHILTTILAANPGLRGTLFDLEHNEAAANALIRSRGMAERAGFVAGSFFVSIPGGRDLYLMSHVIHDWDEEGCLAILRNCRRAMPEHARLLIVEQVLPEGDAFHPGKMLDINMLVQTPGQERSEAEYRELLRKAGFRVERVIPTSAPVSLIEAVIA